MSDEDHLADLLIQWEEILESGRDVSASDLCHDCPHLIEQLSHRIKALKSTAWMDKPVDGGNEEGDSPIPTPDEPPRTLANRYRLDQRIAEGGFAQVWRGYDLELLRNVAIKMPKASLVVAVDSFMAEARRVARLKHPGIVPVHDVGRDNDSCFIVSEFVEGGSLADNISEGSPATEQATRWITDVCEALDYAHSHGVVHRDIKPANILIDHHGRALLADFGIALSANKTGQFAPSLGTLAYMSPEQLEGKPVDPRSDIYSVGVLLCQLLTGKLPYDAHDQNSLRKEIVSGAVHFTSQILSPELRTICLRCLAHDPKERYQSAKELADDLKVLMTATKPNAPRSAKRRAGMIAVSLLCGIGLIAAFWKPNATQQSSGSTIPVEGETSFAVDRETAQWVLSHPAEFVRVRIQEPAEPSKWKYFTSGETLPESPFQISGVEILGSKKLTDADVARYLPALRKLELLWLERNPNLTDATLESLKKVPSIRHLGIGVTEISGIACADFVEFHPLNSLSISANQLIPELTEAIRSKPLLANFTVQHGSDSHLQQILTLPHLVSLHVVFDSSAEMSTWEQFPERLPNLRVLDLNSANVSDAHLKCFVRCPKLKDLGLIHTPITDKGLAALHSCKMLQRLTLLDTNVTPAGVAALQDALPDCQIIGVKSNARTGTSDLVESSADREAAEWAQSLQAGLISLWIEYHKPSGEPERKEIRFKEPLPEQPFRIIHFNVVDSSKVTDADIARYLSPLQKVERIRFEKCPVVTDEVVETLKQLRTVSQLYISHSKVTGQAICDLVAVLPISELGVSTEQGTPELLRLIAELPQLKFLIFYSGTDAQLRQLAAARQLEELYFLNDGSTDLEIWQDVASSLQNLKILGLTSTKVGDAHLAELARLPKLQKLILVNTLVTDEGLPSLHGCKILRELYLSGTKVTSSGVEALQAALPNCRMYPDAMK